MKIKKVILGMVVGFVSLFSIWVAKDLLSESNRQTVAEVHILKDYDNKTKGADSSNVGITPNFNPHDYKDMGEGIAGFLFGGSLKG
jgi:hypothetical protein